MRRRGVGIQAIERNSKANEQFKAAGNALASAQTEQLEEQLTAFKNYLETFSRKYRKEIKTDPQFRYYFQKMCHAVGIDPLASNKGFWAELLGFGDFYYELAVKIVEIGIKTRENNGGLIKLENLTLLLSKDDVCRSIKCLKSLGNGFGIIEIDSTKFLQATPLHLNQDTSELLKLAQKRSGQLKIDEIQNSMAWDKIRIQSSLDILIKDGIAWLDDQDHSYWVTSMFAFFE